MIGPFLKEVGDSLKERVGAETYPLVWTADFIRGEKEANGEDTFKLVELNCDCVGFAQQPELGPVVATAIREMVLSAVSKI